MADIDMDLVFAVEALADELDVHKHQPKKQEYSKPELMSGKLTSESIACALGNLMPENAIIADEVGVLGARFYAVHARCKSSTGLL